MAVFFITGAIAGIILGLRFKVLVLVPAILLATVVIIASGSADKLSVIVLTVVGTIVSLQMGYLLGCMLRARAGLPTQPTDEGRKSSHCAEGNRTNLGRTRVGRILSQSGIDELPQLFNVLRGEMSILGRPNVPRWPARNGNGTSKRHSRHPQRRRSHG